MMKQMVTLAHFSWKRNMSLICLVVAASVLLGAWQANAIMIDFETISDGTVVTNQYSNLGVSFSGATTITAGMTLNELEFPPHSGANVVFDDGSPIMISFSFPVTQIGGYFTYTTPVTVAAYDLSGSILESTTSVFSSNLALSGDPGSSPNEFLQVESSSPIYTLVIQGDLAGYSFTLDDFTFTGTSPIQPTPEPGTLILMAGALVAVFSVRKALR